MICFDFSLVNWLPGFGNIITVILNEDWTYIQKWKLGEIWIKNFQQSNHSISAHSISVWIPQIKNVLAQWIDLLELKTNWNWNWSRNWIWIKLAAPFLSIGCISAHLHAEFACHSPCEVPFIHQLLKPHWFISFFSFWHSLKFRIPNFWILKFGSAVRNQSVIAEFLQAIPVWFLQPRKDWANLKQTVEDWAIN